MCGRARKSCLGRGNSNLLVAPRRLDRRPAVPFGRFLAAGSAIALVSGKELTALFRILLLFPIEKENSFCAPSNAEDIQTYAFPISDIFELIFRDCVDSVSYHCYESCLCSLPFAYERMYKGMELVL